MLLLAGLAEGELKGVLAYTDLLTQYLSIIMVLLFHQRLTDFPQWLWKGNLVKVITRYYKM